jgi:hypothetical protein
MSFILTAEELRGYGINARVCEKCGKGIFHHPVSGSDYHWMEVTGIGSMYLIGCDKDLPFKTGEPRYRVLNGLTRIPKEETKAFGIFEEEHSLRFSFSHTFSGFVAKQVHVGDIFEVACIQPIRDNGIMTNMVWIGSAERRKPKRSRINRLLDWTLRGRA